MGEKELLKANEWFRKSIHWLHYNGEDFDDQDIAALTGYTKQQISSYRNDKKPISPKFIKIYEEKYLSKYNCKLEYFENPAPRPVANYSEEQQALIMLNTKIERLDAAMEVLMGMVEKVSKENGELKKMLAGLSTRAKK